jgi:hypothetical protein
MRNFTFAALHIPYAAPIIGIDTFDLADLRIAFIIWALDALRASSNEK